MHKAVKIKNQGEHEMTHILISFLGKARKNEGGQYRETRYRFAENDIKISRFFSQALAERLRPERLVILGTPGSMWDVFCESLQSDGTALSDAVDTDSVTQAQLQAFEDKASETLGTECYLKLIPYGDDLAEQIEILKIMASNVQQSDRVSLDLTHGLRHLPMLGLLSAMYLQTARNANIEGLYYGALDRTKDGITPVMQLSGLLEIADWLHALDGFNKTGNLAPFSKLLQRCDMSKGTAQCLEDAAFFENTLNIAQARNPLKEFAKATQTGLTGIGALFEDSLKERIAWHKEDKFYLRQRSNAYFYLRQGDYLRAAALGYEAFITWRVQQDKLDPQNYEYRQQVKDRLEKNKDYKLLSNVRNALAHGTRSQMAEVQAALSSREKLHAELSRLFNTLLPAN